MKRDDKQSIEEYVYQEIKNAILHRKIKPKTQLSEESLSEVFQVSRTPIRNVLKKLQYEKLVQIFPNKGAFIYEPTVEEMKEVFHMRKILEMECVRIACRVATDEQLQELENGTYQEEELYKRGEYGHALSKSGSFHLGIVKIAGNQLIYKYCKELNNLTDVYLAFYDNVRIESPLAPCEHRDIVQAIRDRDEDRAAKLFAEHFRRVQEHMVYRQNGEDNMDLGQIFQPFQKLINM
ncbi:GntR family transcriptional regulator [Ammoniphilus sp. 3BR4]|uniref:GntR family transcriptional regulator n=1 Tax=Ammoniphilus sp. 3BR4 TaxID=3158265 RepID=UPI0034658AAC